MEILLRALSDRKYDIQTMTTHEDTITVDVRATARHTAPLALPGLTEVAATGKPVNGPDRFIFTIRNGQTASLDSDSPADGGTAEMLRQLGLRLPS
jgi:hypothetical protein